MSHDPTPLDAARVDPPFLASERESLDAWLEFHRATVLQKVAGLDAEQLCRRAVPPSDLSPLGLVRHLGVVEEYWLREVLLGEARPDPYCTPERPDGDHLDGTPATAATDLAFYRERVRDARAAQASWTDLDAPVRGGRAGEPLNLRWILMHLIEEYARHVGHLDLLREAIDGRTGE
ncbi:DinB family protein [Brachybacterium sp. J153]|uniref:DinB family protein n=1 Tax=Brachybacterium sp. J153 TaxID=3116488 RepID=UPI002E777EC7|nr:DinB family protein [Brachybacterium sp. J153]MEE1618442.1 DinB family protein [Brachybacterium sp. J153]